MSDDDTARVAPATVDDIDPVTDLWIALAAGQRRHGSTLLAEANRAAVREWVARSVVTGDLLVARPVERSDDAGRHEDDAGRHEDDTGRHKADDGVDRDTTTPIGFVGFALDHGGYDRSRRRGTVSNLFVVPERRGEGIGSALLDAAERALREAGAEVVALEALADNDRGREFYAAHGYDRHRVELTKSLSGEKSTASTADNGDETE